ncbi:helix-turn-helix domain-containing protein [Bacteroidales bacterium OttesenSCG-928-J19]|nr:helix-turn-helix domain-containing protein [Bacteroidales bacterium OttesenSCG-928-J19]
MFLDKDYFEDWMQRLLHLLEEIKKQQKAPKEEVQILLPDGDRLLDNHDLCRMLNLSKRTLQHYRSTGELPYEMIRHKTYYRESEVLKFIEDNFDRFRAMKKK